MSLMKTEASVPRALKVQILTAELKAGGPEHPALWDHLLSAFFCPEMKGLLKSDGSRSTKGTKPCHVPTVGAHMDSRLGLQSGPLVLLTYSGAQSFESPVSLQRTDKTHLMASG